MNGFIVGRVFIIGEWICCWRGDLLLMGGFIVDGRFIVGEGNLLLVE